MSDDAPLSDAEVAELERLRSVDRQKNTVIKNPREISYDKQIATGPEAGKRAAEQEMATRAPWEKVLYGFGREPQSLASGVSQLISPSAQKGEQERTARNLDVAGGEDTLFGRIGGAIATSALPMTRAGWLSAPRQAAAGAAIEGARATPTEDRGVKDRVTQAAVGGAVSGVAAAAPWVLKTTLGGGITTPTAEARELMNRGVRVTPGQAAGPASRARGIEDRVAGYPLIGEPIKNAQRRAYQDFSDAAIEEIVSPLNPGLGRLEQIQRSAFPADAARDFIGDGYQQALGGRLMPTQVGIDVANAATQRIQNAHFISPERQQQVIDYVQRAMLNRFRGNGISGEVWKDLDSDLGREGAQLARSSESGERRIGWLLQDIQDDWRAAAHRTMPPAEAQRLQAADAAYRDLVRGERAAAYTGKDQNLITPARLQRAETAMAKGKTPRGDLADLARTGQAVLPSTVPESGTAGRAMLPLLAGGIASGLLPKVAVGAASTHVGYSQPGVRFLTGDVPWGPQVERLANWLHEMGVGPGAGAAGRTYAEKKVQERRR